MALMNGKKSIVDKSKSFIEKLFTEKVGGEYSYHNLDHTMDVYNASLKLSEEAKLKEKDKVRPLDHRVSKQVLLRQECLPEQQPPRGLQSKTGS